MYKSCVEIKTFTKNNAKNINELVLSSSEKSIKNFLKSSQLSEWQKKRLKLLIESGGFDSFETEWGFQGVLFYKEVKNKRPGEFQNQEFGFFRDQVHLWLSSLKGQKEFAVTSLDDSKEALEGVGSGVELCSYSFTRVKKYVVLLSKEEQKTFQKGVKKAEAVNTARFLVDMPPNELKPKAFKDIITKEFSKEAGFKLKVVEREELEKKGYGLISGVGQGADEGPYLVHLSYRTKAKKSKAHLGAVGKGITFDSGGLDLKPSQYMRWMKKDMGGAGSLYGFSKWIKDFKPEINCDFVFAIAENSISEKSFRPGDVLKAQNGKTVEIHNTDAEGRLALASGYNYLNSLMLKFDYCFNLATLTGAIKHGLGDRVGGLFSNSESLSKTLFSLSEKVNDPVWLMPIPYWSDEDLKSDFADMTNCGSGYGGAIVAAEFLRGFAPQEREWFHLDLYCWTDGSRGAFRQKGGTGQGVQLLQAWVESF